jgi:hypothetical protein
VTFPSDGGGCDDAGGDSCEVSLEGRVAGRYTFDRVFAPGASQNDVFESIGRQTVEAVLDGFNAAVLSYGQTGSGSASARSMRVRDLASERNAQLMSFFASFTCMRCFAAKRIR